MYLENIKLSKKDVEVVLMAVERQNMYLENVKYSRKDVEVVFMAVDTGEKC